MNGARERGLKRAHSQEEPWVYEITLPETGGLPQSKLHCRQPDPQLIAFLNLLQDDIIQDFLWIDSCSKLADKYLLAMVFVYFKRAALCLKEYDRFNFFIALYLANDIEEDEEDEKYEIFSWAMGEEWMSQFPKFLLARDQLWSRMRFRAVVSRRTCEEVFAMVPGHPAWYRERQPHHAGAIRPYMKPSSPRYGRQSPVYCPYCAGAKTIPTVSLLPEKEGGDLLDDIDSLLKQGFMDSREE